MYMKKRLHNIHGCYLNNNHILGKYSGGILDKKFNFMLIKFIKAKQEMWAYNSLEFNNVLKNFHFHPSSYENA